MPAICRGRARRSLPHGAVAAPSGPDASGRSMATPPPPARAAASHATIAGLSLGAFSLALGAKLLLIRSFARDVPFWDQWDAEALQVYLPLLEGGFWSVSWLGPHNEHRILWTRLTAGIVFAANGQWDPLVLV